MEARTAHSTGGNATLQAQVTLCLLYAVGAHSHELFFVLPTCSSAGWMYAPMSLSPSSDTHGVPSIWLL